jgi:hypothetical protein
VTKGPGEPSQSRRRRGILTGVVAAFSVIPVALVTLVIWVLARDSRVDLKPEYFIGAEGQSGISLLLNASDVTDVVCGSPFHCESAWGTDQMILMKFGNKNDAAIATRAIGKDAYRSDWLVAHFVGDVSPTERRYAAEVLDGAWQSEVD